MFTRNRVDVRVQKQFKNKYFYVILNIFALSGNPRLAHKIYCGVIVLAVIAAYFWSMFAKFNSVYRTCTDSIIVLDVAINAILLIFNCYSIIHAIKGCNVEERFFKRIETVYNVLIEKFGRAEIKIKTGERWVFTVMHIIFIVQVLNVHLSDSLNKFNTKKFFLDLQLNWSLYMVLLMVLKIYTLNLAIIQAFHLLNTEMFYHISLNSVLDGKDVDDKEFAVFCFFTKVHSELMDSMVLISKSYGFHVLLLCSMLIMVTIQGLNLTLKSVLNYTPIFKGHQLLSSISVGLFIVIYMAFILLIVMSCSHASEESIKTSTISSKILPELSNLRQETTFKKMILLFIAYNKYSENHYSALGFIEIDYETILVLLECFSLYIVLILQFA